MKQEIKKNKKELKKKRKRKNNFKNVSIPKGITIRKC